jgi:hypothetical protein
VGRRKKSKMAMGLRKAREEKKWKKKKRKEMEARTSEMGL